jgi:hypothetical protein
VRCIDCPLHGWQSVKRIARQDFIVSKERGENDPGFGTTLADLWPTYPDLVSPPVQKDFDIGAAFRRRIIEGELAPVLKPVQGCLDMFAGTQAVDAVIRAVAAVDWFCEGANTFLSGISSKLLKYKEWQRPAKPCTSVGFRAQHPLIKSVR